VFIREFYCKYGNDDYLLADALLVLKNTVKNRLSPVFIEVDRAQSNNRFDKVKKYGDFFKSKVWVNQWWTQPEQFERRTYRFPKVLVVTDRPEQVNEVINKENVMEIRFEVIMLEDVMKDIYKFI